MAMKHRAAVAIFSLLIGSAVWADETSDKVGQLESSGDSAGARQVLAKAVQAAPTDLGALSAYASFLERYGDREARPVYRQLLTQANNAGDKARAVEAARRLVLLDLLTNYRSAAT